MAELKPSEDSAPLHVRRAGHCQAADCFLLFHDRQLLIRGDQYLWRKAEIIDVLQTRDCLLIQNNEDFSILTVDLDGAAADALEAERISTREMLMRTGQQNFHLIGQATQLINWYQSHRFCGACGSPTVAHVAERAMLCPRCELSFYPRINPCVIMLVLRGNKILLARSSRPGATFFSCLAGFMEVGETPEETVAREVREEVGLEVSNIRYMRSQSWPFPSQLMLGFFADYAGGEIVPEPEEIAEAGWFDPDQLTVPIPPPFSVAGQLIAIARSRNGTTT